MSMVYEDENKQVTVALTENDYVKVMAMDSKVTMVIRNINGKLVVESTTDEVKKK